MALPPWLDKKDDKKDDKKKGNPFAKKDDKKDDKKKKKHSFLKEHAQKGKF